MTTTHDTRKTTTMQVTTTRIEKAEQATVTRITSGVHSVSHVDADDGSLSSGFAAYMPGVIEAHVGSDGEVTLWVRTTDLLGNRTTSTLMLSCTPSQMIAAIVEAMGAKS